MNFGLLGDYDALPDIDLIADGIDAALQELLSAARGGRPPRSSAKPAAPAGTPKTTGAAPGAGRPMPIVPASHARPTRGPAADMRAKRTRGSQPARKRSDG
jgi:diacylglycerol O-acyltransferase